MAAATGCQQGVGSATTAATNQSYVPSTSSTSVNPFPPLPPIFNAKNGHVPKVRHLKKKSKSVIYWTLPGTSTAIATTCKGGPTPISEQVEVQNRVQDPSAQNPVVPKKTRRFSFFKHRSRSELPLALGGKKTSKRGSSLGLQDSSPALSTNDPPELKPHQTALCCAGTKKSKKHLLGLKSKHKSDNQLLKDVLTPEYGAKKLPGESSPKLTSSPKRASCSAAITDRPPTESGIMKSDSILEKQLLTAVAPNTLPIRLRKLSKAFFAQNGEKIDLMNDWEIGGTQNPWVCPSDRHLQLRAQLKSGWSVRTATARSPTNAKANNNANGLTEAEQEHIRKVLARAEQGKKNEEERLGKMVDRLEKMRSRATGNGVTQCLICQTEFGLLASKSYAAMCLDCRKYVCQKSCGVETYDNKRKELIFLCKICSEYREVIWKKSGAWFYKELPQFSKPEENGGAGMGYRWQHNSSFKSAGPSPTSAFPSRTMNEVAVASSSVNNVSQAMPSHRVSQRQLPIPPENQQRLKTTPRPRITPSWVHDKVQSSMSICSEDETDSSSSVDPNEFKQGVSSHAIPPSRRHHYRPRAVSNKETASKHSSASSAGGRSETNLQRYVLGSRNRITDTDESDNDDVSRRTTPSTSPRHSIATPSSYGGDDISQNHASLAADVASDAKSIDSGVVQSDHSNPQTQLHQNHFNNSNSTPIIPITPKSFMSAPGSEPAWPSTTPTANGGLNLNPTFATSFKTMPNSSPNQGYTPNSTPKASIRSVTPSQQMAPPPIPPRTGGASPTSQLGEDWRPSSASSSTASSSMHLPKSTPFSNDSLHLASNIVQRHRPGSSYSSDVIAQRMASIEKPSSNRTSNSHGALETIVQESVSPSKSILTEKKWEEAADSPTFMSSPEDDSKMPIAASLSLKTRRELKEIAFRKVSKTLSLNIPSFQFHDKLCRTNSGNSSVSEISDAPDRPQLPKIIESGSSFGSLYVEQDTDDCRKVSQFTGPKTLQSTSQLTMAHLTVVKRKKSTSLFRMCFPKAVNVKSGRGRDDSYSLSTLGSIQFNLTYLPDEKQLIIHLIRAKNLKAMDKNGFSDPYVKLHLIPGNTKATKLTSKTIEKTLNPEWHEELVYHGITEDERQRKTLRVTVLDRDRIGSDFLGETRVALKKLPPGQMKKFNLYLEHAMAMPVEKPDGGERGKLLVGVSYNIQQASLFVHIKRGVELLGMDSTGFSDPYCKVSLTPLSSKSHRLKTTIKKRTLNPEFNETLQFIVPFKDLPKKTLEIGVYDHDVGRHDDYIGGILLSTTAKGDRGKHWTQVIENPGKTFEYWHKLEA